MITCNNQWHWPTCSLIACLSRWTKEVFSDLFLRYNHEWWDSRDKERMWENQSIIKWAPSSSIYPLPKFLLEKQTEQVVGHSKPNRGPDNQHLLQPGRERPLVERDSTHLEQITRELSTEFDWRQHYYCSQFFRSICRHSIHAADAGVATWVSKLLTPNDSLQGP